MEVTNWLLLLVMLTGTGLTGYSQFLGDGNTLNELIRNALLAGGGGGGLLYNNFSWLLSKLKSTKVASKLFKPADHELRDFECLVHLRKRFEQAENKEGVAACSLLNCLVFDLMKKEQDEKLK